VEPLSDMRLRSAVLSLNQFQVPWGFEADCPDRIKGH
jgi:hypothetical protein